MEFNHIPVIPSKTVEYLNLKPGAIALDGTFGLGGHSKLILEKIGEKGILYANDCDLEVEPYYLELKNKYKNIFITYRRFSEIEKISADFNQDKFDAVLVDIGVSSMQFDNGERGFSFQNDGPIDMRMDTRSDFNASNVLNEYPEKELADIFYKYGEEHRSRIIAKHIVKRRKINKIETTNQLKKIIEEILPKRGKIHPSTKVFQSLRIYVNNELGELEKFLSKIMNYINPNGRLAVISFHSLEDRIVKNKFKELAGKCICGRPLMECDCKKEKIGKIITKKPILAERDEIRINRRSRSAKLRVIEKI